MAVLRRLQHGEAKILAKGIMRHHDTDVLRMVESQPDWKLDGLCNQVGVEWFYPEKGENATVAKKVCNRCPVIAECLAYALENDEQHGVWGGKSSTQRKRLRPTRSDGRFDGVKERQLVAYRMLDAGVTAVEVAKRMGVSVRTVERWKSAR
jgi:WhiB family redox-sensing transcriptional regulator